MNCELCKGKTVKRKVRKQHWFQGKLYLIENVEAEVCQECGERYFHAKTLDVIDHLLEGKHEVKESIQVEVVSLN
ncbi:MAG TPA: YgiT-type zinc finger protein [Candidatus Hypogeohydataceae bacterium YC41]